MVARLERHVQVGIARALPGLRERDRLGVVDLRVLVPAFAHDLVAVHDHGAHHRVILDFAATALRKLERALKPVHASACTSWRYAR